jgi:hypothetical protein
LNEIGRVTHLHVVEINFNLTAAASGARVVQHVLVQLYQRVVGRLGADIKHHHLFRFDELANALEKPLVRVDLPIIAMFDAKHKVYPVRFQNVELEPEIL